MSKSIKSYPESKRKEVIERRLKNDARGLGYLAALDAQKRAEKKQTEK